MSLGREDGFDQDEYGCDGDECPEVPRGLCAVERDALEAIPLADLLLDPRPASADGSGETLGDRLAVLLMRDGGEGAAGVLIFGRNSHFASRFIQGQSWPG